MSLIHFSAIHQSHGTTHAKAKITDLPGVHAIATTDSCPIVITFGSEDYVGLLVAGENSGKQTEFIHHTQVAWIANLQLKG